MKLEIQWYAIPISLLIGLFLAWLVYRNQLNKQYYKWLFGLRTLGLTLLFLLLFEPSIHWVSSREVKPLLVLYRDASKSANLDTREQSLQINSLIQKRFNGDIEVQLIAFGSELMGESWDSLAATDNNTAVSKSQNNNVENSNDFPWIRLSNNMGFETRLFEVTQDLLEIEKRKNAVGALLISDGILNSGPSPTGISRKFVKPLLVIGTGDSSRIPDVSVKELMGNDDVFLGNSTSISGEVEFQNLENSQVKLELLEDGKVIQTKLVQLTSSNFSGKQGNKRSNSIKRQNYQFDYVGKQVGAHFLQVRCSSVQDENLKNNLVGKSIRVIDRKKKIAIVYGKPHPDIKAIAESLSTTVQNEVVLSSENEPLPAADLYILHGIENARSFESIEQNNLPIWVFANTPASLVYANKNSGVSVANISRITTFQTVGISSNSEFSLFDWGMNDYKTNQLNTMNNSTSVNSAALKLQNIWGGVSAVLVKLNPGIPSMTQFKQVWNNTLTEFPLCNLNVKGDVSSVWFWGEGIWKCRMNEFRKRSSTDYFDAWVNNNVQWLGRNPSDNNGFRIITSSDQTQLGKLTKFKVVRLDAAGNKSNSDNILVQMLTPNGQTKELNVLKTDQEYVGNFVPSQDGLMKIKVQLKGSPNINAEKMIQVNSYSLEEKNLCSDFDLLRKFARNHQGDFVIGLRSNLSSPEEKSKINSEVLEKVESWIIQNKLNQIKLVDENRNLTVKDFWGYLALIALIFTVEWILRKRFGQV